LYQYLFPESNGPASTKFASAYVWVPPPPEMRVSVSSGLKVTMLMAPKKALFP